MYWLILHPSHWLGSDLNALNRGAIEPTESRSTDWATFWGISLYASVRLPVNKLQSVVKGDEQLTVEFAKTLIQARLGGNGGHRQSSRDQRETWQRLKAAPLTPISAPTSGMTLATCTTVTNTSAPHSIELTDHMEKEESKLQATVFMQALSHPAVFHCIQSSQKEVSR